jgi:NAD(P)-dependent dehydrogenase (short-subunit alcohol dehydrogenase family)
MNQSIGPGTALGPVAVVTGAGRGIGRAHALTLAARGYRVVVNDLGVGLHGESAEESPAQEVAAEIRSHGGQAIASRHDVSDWSAAGELIQSALTGFGRLDVLVNNAGIIRDAVLYKMTEREWDDVIRVHLRATAATSHHAAVHWRERSRSGEAPGGRLINTTSASGMFGNVGQANYAAAKAGIIGLSLTASIELQRYGVTVNVIAPMASSRMLSSVGAAVHLDLDPQYVAHVAAWLCGPGAADVTGRVFAVGGRDVYVGEGWSVGPSGQLSPEGDPDQDADLLGALVASAPQITTVATGSPFLAEARGSLQ